MESDSCLKFNHNRTGAGTTAGDVRGRLRLLAS
jgi:hypothetical protein